MLIIMAQVPIPLTALSNSSTSQPLRHFERKSPTVCPLAKLGRSSPSVNKTKCRSPALGAGCKSPLDPSVYSFSRGISSSGETCVYSHQTFRSSTDHLSYRNSLMPVKEGSKYFSTENDFNESSFCGFSVFMDDSCKPKGISLSNNYHSLITGSEIKGREAKSSFEPSVSTAESLNLRHQKLRNDPANDGPGRNLTPTESSLYQQSLINHGYRPQDPVNSLKKPSSCKPYVIPTTDLEASYPIGRSSPSLDQGYHTLVSPCSGFSTPRPWIDYNPLSFSSTSTKGKKYLSRISSSVFDKLPDEAIVKIFTWLDSSDLCTCARVCKRWESLVWEPQLWRIIKLSGETICGDKAVRSVLRRLCGHGTTGACPTVEKVFLSDGAKITDKGLTQLSRRCTELTHLQLHGCSAVTNNAVFELVTKCTNLQHLDLTGCFKVSFLCMVPGPEPPRLLLQYLDLTDCSAVDDSGLKVVVRNSPQLVCLYLRRCVQITDTGVKFIPSFCSMLRELSISDCNRITDFGLHELAKLGATLRYLSVAKCDRVSDAGLKVIARRCYKLRYLNARGCEAVSDDAITVLARSCSRLRALDIGKCDVSDAGLRALAECCPNLKKLSLRNCDLITDRGVQCIAYYCRGLQQLNIQDCQISLDGYRAVKKYCKRCVIEHTNPGFF